MKNKIITSVLVLSLVMVFILSVSSVSAVCNPSEGSIWTTRNGCNNQINDANQFVTGEKVYINGKNFECLSYSWTITGQPGSASTNPGIIIASGIKTLNSTGSFCFEAYTIKADDEGTYKIDFGTKKDTYRANEKLNDNKNPIALVPEFEFYVGLLTLVSALGLFFVVRRK